jgi:hypothetical protein
MPAWIVSLCSKLRTKSTILDYPVSLQCLMNKSTNYHRLLKLSKLAQYSRTEEKETISTIYAESDTSRIRMLGKERPPSWTIAVRSR